MKSNKNFDFWIAYIIGVIAVLLATIIFMIIFS